MNEQEPHPALPKPKLRWYQFSLRGLLVFVLLVSIAMSALTAYFRPARLDGEVLYVACVCGFKRARISDGKVILSEPNHARPAGSVVATIEIEDGKCILRDIREDGKVRSAGSYEIDHLGAKYYDDRFGGFVYVIMADNWKLYPFSVFERIRRMFQ
jgi:hypothetical protein